MKRVLISVYKKDGVLELAKELAALDFEIISTGGTYKYLKENGLSPKSVEEITGFPEVLGGRVKTLHPVIFSGILADRHDKAHNEELKKHNLQSFNLVVVNLYPFEETIAKKETTIDEAIEQIDIGGVSLIRAAAKNFKSVSVLVSPEQYNEYLTEYKSNKGHICHPYSIKIASEAFTYIAKYDKAIANYFLRIGGEKPDAKIEDALDAFEKKELRYGENPHQKAYLYKENFDSIFRVIHGKEISYNNLLDIDSAVGIINEFENDRPAAAIIKHGHPCGVAVSGTLKDAYIKAFETDTVSPFGGIIIFNKNLDLQAASEADKIFSEIILAPAFEKDALELLIKKKNRRLVEFKFNREKYEFKKISGGVLYQERDNIVLKNDELKVVTKLEPDEKQKKDCEFAFKIVKHTKSNAVVFIKDERTLAIGGGQPSRVDSTKIAIQKAEQFGIDLKGSVVASDAFFPFADGVEALAKAGGICVIQPGGSVRDDEVIAAADKLCLVMLFTGYRHFIH